jgi:ABC-2 type transport system ATP-binding protein
LNACILRTLVHLDEPTTGLDPRSRSDLWDVLRGLVEQGTTLLLTTQYLEEADQLADNIVVVDKGRIIAEGAADGLADMVRVAGWLRDSDIDVDDIGLSRPSLDDVFLSLTGLRAEETVEA